MTTRLSIILFLSFFFINCNNDDSEIYDDSVLYPERQTVVNKTISSEGGRLTLSNINGDSVILEIPQDALSEEVSITMRVLDNPPESPISNIVFPGVDLEPHDLIFNTPVQIKIKFLENIDQAETISIFNILEENEIRLLKTNKISDSQINAEIIHFSRYSAGRIASETLTDLIITNLHLRGDADALEILLTLQDIISILEWAEKADVLGKTDLANQLRNNALGVLEEMLFQLLDSTPSNPCGEYETALNFFSEVVEEYLGSSEALKTLKLKLMELDKQCDDDGSFDICEYIDHIALSSQALSISKGETHQLNLSAYNSDGELLEEYSLDEEWKSDDPSIATVQNGLVTAGDQSGSTVITVSVCGQTASCTVEVSPDCETNPLQMNCDSEWEGSFSFRTTGKYGYKSECESNDYWGFQFYSDYDIKVNLKFETVTNGDVSYFQAIAFFNTELNGENNSCARGTDGYYQTSTPYSNSGYEEYGIWIDPSLGDFHISFNSTNCGDGGTCLLGAADHVQSIIGHIDGNGCTLTILYFDTVREVTDDENTHHELEVQLSRVN